MTCNDLHMTLRVKQIRIGGVLRETIFFCLGFFMGLHKSKLIPGFPGPKINKKNHANQETIQARWNVFGATGTLLSPWFESTGTLIQPLFF